MADTSVDMAAPAPDRAEVVLAQHPPAAAPGPLSALIEIQRAITQRVPLEELLDVVVEATSDLIAGSMVSLLVRDAGEPEVLRMVAHRGWAPEDGVDTLTRQVGVGVAGTAVAESRLVLAENYVESPYGLREGRELGITSSMATPIHEDGHAVGALVVLSRVPERAFTADERDLLVALAECASLAFNDARTIAEMTRQALHDPLTGLPNRSLFADRLQHARDRARRTGATIAVMFCDLDRFKTINDSLGHAVGDELLTQVARRLDQCLRAGDTAARLGGDEFAILLEDVAGEPDAAFVADRVLSALRRPIVVAGRELFGHASIGIALASGGEDIDLLRRADVAMYRAKALGRGRSVLFEPSMQLEAVERVMLEADLDRALDRDELEVHFQPIVDLQANVLAGFEALARWRHPSRGLLGADAFVPLAEETGRLPNIGRHVLREACHVLADVRERYPDANIDIVSVNLSAGELSEVGLRAEIAAVLADTGIPPSCLVLEITESSLIGDTPQTLRTLQSLKDLGIRLAVDDFGTGYSAMRYLSVLPIDLLKMAKPFVDDLERGGREAALCGAIVDLAGNLALHLVAEGIENAGQAHVLRQQGCSHGQGYYFDRALSRNDLINAIADDRANTTWARGPVALEERGLIRIVPPADDAALP